MRKFKSEIFIDVNDVVMAVTFSKYFSFFQSTCLPFLDCFQNR